MLQLNLINLDKFWEGSGMKNLFYAKTGPIQTIEQHTDQVLEQMEKLHHEYPNIISDKEWDILKTAIIYHDLGKINTKFQNKIYKAIGIKDRLKDDFSDRLEIPHGYLSTAFFNMSEMKKTFNREELRILISSVYYHHDRYEVDEEYIKEFIERDLYKYKDYFLYSKVILPNKLRTNMSKYTNRNMLSKEGFISYVKVKGLLNRLDYVASAGLDTVEIRPTDQQGKGIEEKVLAKFSKLRPVQEYMYQHQDKNLIIVASTGIGKTEASLLWIGNSKGFFTLPLKVSINAIYDRIRNDIEYKKVALLHSDAYSQYMQQCNYGDYGRDLYTQARLLAAPLTVCTVDQLFRFVFQYNGFEYLLATLMYSRIVIDEIQMYSPDVVAYILYGLKMIDEFGGKFAIVTATFPKIFEEMMHRLNIRFYSPEKPFLIDQTRHRIRILEEDFDYDLIEKLSQKYKVLVIVNTVSKAQRVYDSIETKNKRLLHSHFIKKHREILERDIIAFANEPDYKEDKGIWISTQIVESSLDIDFDILCTEMCSIDSLFQRMGRVYRKRNLDHTDPNVYIYINYSGEGNIIDPDIYRFSVTAIKDYNGKVLSESDKQQIIDTVFDPEINNELKDSAFFNTLQEKIHAISNVTAFELTNKTAIKLFRNIVSIKIIPESIYEELYKDGIVEQWESILRDKNSTGIDIHKVKMEIDKYTLNLSHYHGYPIDRDDLFYRGSGIYRCRCPYDFDIEKRTGKGMVRISKKKFIQQDLSNFL